jgi:hypothetical protein
MTRFSASRFQNADNLFADASGLGLGMVGPI